MPTRFVTVIALASALLSSACSATAFDVRPAPEVAGPGIRALAVVRVATPWYAPRFVVRSKFHDALPEYEGVASLDAKYFTITDAGEFGGIYLWKTRDDAELHFDAAWRSRVREKRGTDANVEIVDAPFVIEGRARPRGTPEGTRSIAFPAWASFVRLQLPRGADVTQSARALAAMPYTDGAMIRAFVVTGPSHVGVAALWATREAAERAVADPSRAAASGVAGAIAASSSFTLFEAPLLVDAQLRGP